MHRTVLMVAVLLSISATVQPPAAAQEGLVDLELVFAVDASGSVDGGEWALQLGGIAAAFRDPAVHAAIEAGAIGRIAVSLVVWADATVPKDESDWFVVSNASEANLFAQAIERFPRRVVGGTGIGSGIAHAVRHLDSNRFQGIRRVVDVSGDGIETPPRDFAVLIDQARAMAHARGVTVNGLTILNEVSELDRWYRNHVRTGPDSFVMTADDYEDFAVAIRAKILREIGADPPLAALRPGPAPVAVGPGAH